jgi:uncharacterized protein YbjT (DUF2867 family)
MKKVLIAGATGNLGPHLIRELSKQGHQVSALVRTETLQNQDKMRALREAGVNIIEGDLGAPASLTRACAGQDIVVSAVGAGQIMQQVELARAAHAAGVQRFIPSEFGVDPFAAASDSCDLFQVKVKAQEEIKKIGIAMTPIYTNGFMEFWATGLGQLGPTTPPDTVQQYGDGDKEAYMVSLPDIARYVHAIIEDPTSANKELTIQSEKISQNELIDLWEQISGKTVKKTPVSAEEMDKVIDSSTTPDTMMQRTFTQLHRSVWIRGEGNIHRENVVNAVELYPAIKPIGFRDYLSNFK